MDSIMGKKYFDEFIYIIRDKYSLTDAFCMGYSVLSMTEQLVRDGILRLEDSNLINLVD